MEKRKGNEDTSPALAGIAIVVGLVGYGWWRLGESGRRAWLPAIRRAEGYGPAPADVLPQLEWLAVNRLHRSDTSDESGVPETAIVQPSDSSDTHVAAATAKAAGADVFDAWRQRHFDQGILTEFGRDEGCVAFQPSPFFGRFLGEVAYSLNDALRRLEGNTSYYVMSGDGDMLQNYFTALDGRLGEVGKDLDGIIAWCGRKVA